MHAGSIPFFLPLSPRGIGPLPRGSAALDHGQALGAAHGQQAHGDRHLGGLLGVGRGLSVGRAAQAAAAKEV